MLPESARTEPPLAARVSAAIILPVLIACLACLVLARPAFASTEYSDVDEDAWYKGCVTYVSNRGFMTGYEGTDLFGPEDLVTRAQAVTAIYRAVTGDPEGRTSDPARYSHRDDWSGFSDTYGNAYCTAAINWAAERGVAFGSDGLFRPDDPVTREELMVFMGRAVGCYWPSGLIEPDLSDWEFLDEDSVSWWAKPYLKWGTKFVMHGYQGDCLTAYLMPEKLTTRAEASMMLARLNRDVLSYMKQGIPTGY